MGYVKYTWVDRAVQYAKRYTLSLISGSTYDIDAVPGTVTNAGTTVTAARMNNIENALEAVHNGQHNFGVSSVGTDAYKITFATPFTSLVAGMIFCFKADVANTGACTFQVDSTTVKSVTKNGAQALDDGDIPAGSIVTVQYDGTNYQLISVVNPKMKKQVFTAGGTFTAPITGVFKVTVVGGGGSSGKSYDGSGYCGGGGGGGTSIKWVSLTKNTAVTVTIGQGGVAPAGNVNQDGNAGGTSSFGSHCSASGGNGGYRNATFANGGSGGTGSSGDVNLTGGPGGVQNSSFTIPMLTSPTNPYGAGGAPGSANNGNAGIIIVEWNEI